MTEAELMALVALTQQETVLMASANLLREQQGYSPMYGDDNWGPYHKMLHDEMAQRFTFFRDAFKPPEPLEEKAEPWFHGNNPECMGHAEE